MLEQCHRQDANRTHIHPPTWQSDVSTVSTPTASGMPALSIFTRVYRGGGGGLPPAGHTQRNQASPTAEGPTPNTPIPGGSQCPDQKSTHKFAQVVECCCDVVVDGVGAALAIGTNLKLQLWNLNGCPLGLEAHSPQICSAADGGGHFHGAPLVTGWIHLQLKVVPARQENVRTANMSGQRAGGRRQHVQPSTVAHVERKGRASNV